MKKLAIKTQNKAGNEPKYKENLGLATIFLHTEDWISIDLFEGFGNSYKQRKTEEIIISNNGSIVFKGNLSELTKILKSQ